MCKNSGLVCPCSYVSWDQQDLASYPILGHKAVTSLMQRKATSARAWSSEIPHTLL